MSKWENLDPKDTAMTWKTVSIILLITIPALIVGGYFIGTNIQQTSYRQGYDDGFGNGTLQGYDDGFGNATTPQANFIINWTQQIIASHYYNESYVNSSHLINASIQFRLLPLRVFESFQSSADVLGDWYLNSTGESYYINSTDNNYPDLEIDVSKFNNESLFFNIMLDENGAFDLINFTMAHAYLQDYLLVGLRFSLPSDDITEYYWYESDSFDATAVYDSYQDISNTTYLDFEVFPYDALIHYLNWSFMVGYNENATFGNWLKDEFADLYFGAFDPFILHFADQQNVVLSFESYKASQSIERHQLEFTKNNEKFYYLNDGHYSNATKYI